MDVQYANAEQTLIVWRDGDSTHYVPVQAANRYYQLILAWVGQGNTIAAYEAPPVDNSPQVIENLQHRGELFGAFGKPATTRPVLTTISAATVAAALAQLGLVEDGT